MLMAQEVIARNRGVLGVCLVVAYIVIAYIVMAYMITACIATA